VRKEIRERASLTVTSRLSMAGVIEFSPAFWWPGGKVTTGWSGNRVVRDVSVWWLRLLGWHASRTGLGQPVLRVWPGRIVPPSAPLLTIDLSSGPSPAGGRANASARLAFPSTSSPVLDTLHAETLDGIRAARPVEATAGMRRLADLCAVIWQAYAAYGLTYDYDARRAFYPYLSTAGERLMDLLDDELRAAAASRDDKIRWDASGLPRRLAGEALAEGASRTIQQSLGTLLNVYSSDLTEDGRNALPRPRPRGHAFRRRSSRCSHSPAVTSRAPSSAPPPSNSIQDPHPRPPASRSRRDSPRHNCWSPTGCS
jgi:hypothetical protein